MEVQFLTALQEDPLLPWAVEMPQADIFTLERVSSHRTNQIESSLSSRGASKDVVGFEGRSLKHCNIEAHR